MRTVPSGSYRRLCEPSTLWRAWREVRRHAWRCHLDIAAYFPSVDLQRLEALIFRRLRDPDTRRLIELLLDGGARVYRTAAARKILGPPREGRRGLLVFP